MSSWQTKSSKIVYENPWMIVREDQVVMPGGSDGMYGYVESKNDAVFVIPVDGDGSTYIIQQEHYPVRKVVWQFVGGRTDNQPPEVAAKRELQEETGLSASSITILSQAHSAQGLSTFKGTFCLARDFIQSGDALDPDEGILQIKKLPLQDVEAMILAGEIENVESIALYFLAKSYIEKEKTV